MGTYHKYKVSKHGAHHSYRITNSGNIDQRHFTQANKIAEGNRILSKILGYSLLILLGIIFIIGIILLVIQQIKEFLN